MGGGSSQQTQTTTNQPYGAAKPLLDWSMGQGMSLAKKGALGKPLTMSTVVPMADQTTQGLSGMMGQAEGQTGGMSSGLSALQGIVGVGPGNVDPNFQKVVDRSVQKASEGANSMAAGMGRYGSGAHTGVLARETGDLANRMYSDHYQQNINNIMNASAMMPSAYQASMMPYDTMRQVGGAYEDLYGRQLNDQLRIAQETRDAPLKNIQNLLGIAGGAGQYGTSQQTAQMPNNGLSQALGYGLGGLSMLGSGMGWF